MISLFIYNGNRTEKNQVTKTREILHLKTCINQNVIDCWLLSEVVG